MNRDVALAEACAACGSVDVETFFDFGEVPVFCNVLYGSKDEALAAARAPIRLARCDACGLVFNPVFDADLVGYSSDYENALHFSPRFQQYAEATVTRLINRYDIRSRRVVEIGCGDGHFLDLMCRLGRNYGIGFDPSMAGKLPVDGVSPSVEIVPERFDAGRVGTADLVCCRHVLEHIARPLPFLETLRAALGSREAVVFFEVPNGEWLLDSLSMWDVIYEHCTYFTAGSLTRLFRAAGFEPLAVEQHYEGQFLTIEARPARVVRDGGDSDLAAVAKSAGLFASGCQERLDAWRERLERLIETGRRAVVWGAGSKGVTFVNALGSAADAISCLVDINPRKRGKRVPGTGHRIAGPDDLVDTPPDEVFVMNPVYADEVGELLAERGLSPRIIVV